ncbi:SPOR domain-containing protein [candidate division WOR-3 bacterium]|nr:SPOR domain-containing protein [candidate division WOR-3 bacterium]
MQLIALLLFGAVLADGFAAVKAGSYEEARRILAAQTSGSEAAQANLWLGRLESDPTRAKVIYLKVVETYSQTPFADSALLEVAKLEYALGHYSQSATYFQKLANTYPKSPLLAEVHYWLGMCQGIMGNSSTAQEHFQRVKTLAPRSLWATLASREVAGESSADTSSAVPPPPQEGGFAVQVGSFTDRSRAEGLLSEYQAAGRSGEIRQAVINGETYYRVWLGPFATDSEAASYAETLKAQGKAAMVIKR